MSGAAGASADLIAFMRSGQRQDEAMKRLEALIGRCITVLGDRPSADDVLVCLLDCHEHEIMQDRDMFLLALVMGAEKVLHGDAPAGRSPEAVGRVLDELRKNGVDDRQWQAMLSSFWRRRLAA